MGTVPAKRRAVLQTLAPQRTAHVLESTPLRVVADMVRAGSLAYVTVSVPGEPVRHAVRGDAVLRVGQRVPDAPVGMLPTIQVRQVAPQLSSHDALQLITQPGVEALVTVNHDGWWILPVERLASHR